MQAVFFEEDATRLLCEVIAKDMKNEKEKSDASVEVREDVSVDGTL